MTDEVKRTLLQFNTDLHRLFAEGKLAEFGDLARQAAAYGRLHLPAADPDLGVLLLDLANAERDLGRYFDAIGPCEEAAFIFSGSFDTLRDYVLAVNNWGDLLSRTGELAKAEALFSEAARVSKARGFDQAFATAQNNIGFLHVATGRYKTGERRIRLALRVRRHTLPRDHPEIANSLNNLGDLYVRNGAYKKARKMFDDPVPACDASTEALGDGSDLRGMVLDPLTSWSPGTTRWIVAPDSNISWLPFDALPATDGNRVFDRYTLSYVSSARDLTRPRVTAPAGPPLIVAAPDFDLASGRTDAMPSGELDWGPVTRSLADRGVQFGRSARTTEKAPAAGGGVTRRS